MNAAASGLSDGSIFLLTNDLPSIIFNHVVKHGSRSPGLVVPHRLGFSVNTMIQKLIFLFSPYNTTKAGGRHGQNSHKPGHEGT